MSLQELFCDVDDFWQAYRPHYQRELLTSGAQRRIRPMQLCESEIMTLLIHFHQSSYRNFKHYYEKYVQTYLSEAFPKLVSYNRFIALIPRVGIPLVAYLQQCQGNCSGIAFIDSTPIAVCHNKRIERNKVFAGLAQRGKTSMGWFYGFKLHLIVNDRGEILTFRLTPGNIDDRKPVPQMAQPLFGKLFGDKGYLSKPLFQNLFDHGVQLITMLRKNMKNQLVILEDKLLSRKRSIIETINDQLKNISQIEHSRHRSVNNFFVNLVAGLVAYCHQPKKPALNLSKPQLALLPVAL